MKGEKDPDIKKRDGESGAAMVMALLVTFLLLVGATGLLLESSKNTANVTDAVGEQQAYNAAESGLQSAIHVLRCQKNELPGCAAVRANPLLDASKGATDPANQINYRRALAIADSNASGDTIVPRLSRWLPYNGTGEDGRVILDSNGAAYTTSQGYAYSLAIEDPDNTGSWVSFTVTGKLFDSDTGDVTQKTYSTTTGALRVKYTAPPVLNSWNLGAEPLPSPYFGTFTVSRPTVAGLAVNPGAVIPAMNRFEITVRMTRPYAVTKTMRGWIKTTSNPSDIPRIIFDSKTLTIAGGDMNLDFQSTTWLDPQVVLTGSPVGYEAGAVLGNNIIKGTMTAPEPIRLLIRSTGYGPRGAKKELQAIIQKNFFNGLTAPAALTLVGPRETTNPATSFSFNAGQSAVVTYSGADQTSTDMIPPIGTTDDGNLAEIENFLAGNTSPPFNGSIVGTASNVGTELPSWLESPSNIDAEMQRLATTALPYRFFPSGSTPTSFGNYATGQGLTFCDGNVTFTGEGGGILVVTGTLDLKGAFKFKGLIIVTGTGGLTRSGGGNGEIAGNVVVAPYFGSRIADTQALSSTFLAPQYNMEGGGNSTLVYNSQSLANGLTAISNFVLGVMEK